MRGEEKQRPSGLSRAAGQGLANPLALLLARGCIRLLIAQNPGQSAESAANGAESVSVDLLDSASEVMDWQRVNANSRPKEDR